MRLPTTLTALVRTARFAALFSVLFLPSCSVFLGPAHGPLTQDGIQGEWLFAFERETRLSSAPPRYDIMDFERGDRVRLKESLTGREFEGTFDLTGNTLKLNFAVPGRDEPAEMIMAARMRYRHSMLIVTLQDSEFVYCRRSRLLSDDLSGKWIAKADGKTVTMILGEDGSYQHEKGTIRGYYRLWQSQHGKTMMTAMFVPSHGAFAFQRIYKRDNDKLVLIPIGPRGPDTKLSITWTLVK